MFKDLLKQQAHLDPLPEECYVIRLARLPKSFSSEKGVLAVQLEGLEEDFQLSSTDKNSTPPHLSVWVDELTTPEQAYNFLPENSPRKLVLRLKVNEIRQIVGNSGESVYSNLLNVIWVFLFRDEDKKIRDERPGAMGHSGIRGLAENDADSRLSGLLKRQKKNLRKDLRAKLAELASKDVTSLQ